ncbi:unnamed protein product [Miscanthus lutarioriparius]|uniref:BTB domain-containing protein n=1 Tax=Miscanthus lutarioriparius TaxID=422564 RepID=A0A811M8R8_9POAL|nr:unnamed protein product [Miscanthus lutarioriparius]
MGAVGRHPRPPPIVPVLDPRLAGLPAPALCSPGRRGKAKRQGEAGSVVELLTLPSVEMATSMRGGEEEESKATTGGSRRSKEPEADRGLQGRSIIRLKLRRSLHVRLGGCRREQHRQAPYPASSKDHIDAVRIALLPARGAVHVGAFVPEPHLPCGLPVADALEPALDACLRPVDHVGALAASYRRVSAATAGADDDLCDAYLEQHALFQSIGDARLIRRALRAARVHADNPHRRAVLSQRGSVPRAAVFASVSHSVDPLCPCRRPPPPPITPPPHRLRRNTSGAASEMSEEEEPETNDLWFIIGEEEVACERSCIAALSKPLNTLLYGGFAEAHRDRIDFSRDGITPRGMRAVSAYSRHGRVDDFPPDIISQLLAFANKFCCEGLKAACDNQLAAMVRGLDNARSLIDIGLEEASHLLVASCLQAFLREPQDMRSNTTVMLLERLNEFAEQPWQKQLALHQLGCVMLQRGEFEEAQEWFEAAVAEGHVYSLAGEARAKYKRGHKTRRVDVPRALLYCVGKEKLADLQATTELDPTMTFPYKYRACALLEEDNSESAIAEISKVVGFKMATDCLELRAWFYLALEQCELAVQDVRAILTLDPTYMMFHGRMHGEQLIELLRGQVRQWDMADCWMELYDRWSAVDDIGSLAVVQQMLAREPGNSSLRFRQSLLLLRLNCQKAAMRSLRYARNSSLHEHERLVYEGWILYDSGHRDEALAKAEQSIGLQRSFEAFFLKAYALGDSSLDTESSLSVAYNNMGSIYVDCDMLDEAAECYGIALNIKHTRAHQGLARVHYLKNRKKVAYEEMTKLVQIATNSASAYEKRSEYGERDAARSDLNTATLLDPTRTYPYRYRAAVLMDEGKEEEAIAELSGAVAFKPDLQLLHLRAAFFDSMGDSESALRDCEAALCLDPTHTATPWSCTAKPPPRPTNPRASRPAAALLVVDSAAIFARQNDETISSLLSWGGSRRSTADQ